MEQREQFIQDILQEVYQRLSNVEEKRNLVIFGDLREEQNHLLSKYYKIIKPEKKEIILDVVLISELTNITLAHLALGIPNTLEETICLQALLQGNHVYVLESGIKYHRYKETSAKNLYMLYSDYEKKLRQYGIQFISTLEELFQLHQPKKNHLYIKKQKENLDIRVGSTDLSDLKLITEKDLIYHHLYYENQILVKNNCIITPMAYDFIRTHHIKIKKI